MNFKHMKRLHWTASAVAMSTAIGFSGQALAQVDEIIVTAQKREQSIQDVPIAVSAFDADFLDDKGVDDVLELQFFTPGLTVANNQSAAQTNFNIRGVGTAGNSLALESSVGVYVDGVYRSRQSSAIGDLVDLERVEVLKGPQGTLFGRNTASGAVQFISVAPQPEFGGYGEFSYGNLDYVNFNGAVNIPIVEDVLATRFSGAVTKREGYVDNIATGSKLNDRDRYQVRGQALFTPNESVSFRLIADYSELDEMCCSASNWLDGPADSQVGFVTAHALAGTTAYVDALPNASYVIDLQTLAGLVGVSDPVVLANRFDDDVTSTDIDPYATIEEWGLSGQLDWDINGVTLTSITAYRSYESFDAVDADFTALDILSESSNAVDQKTFSQELRLAGEFGERTQYVVGAYYFDQSLDNTNTLTAGEHANTYLAGGLSLTDAGFGGSAATCSATLELGFGLDALTAAFLCAEDAFPGGEGAIDASEQSHTSWAVFGQVDFDITEQLILTLGARYNNEKKELDVRFGDTIPFIAAVGVFSALDPSIPDVVGAELDDEQVTGTAKLTYFWTPDLMTYASWGRGYKAGGTNTDRVSPSTGATQLFEPEISTSYEVGFKGDFFDNRVRINAAAYMTDFEDFQSNTFVGTGFVLQNAGEIQTRGAEVEIFAVPTDWLSLSTGVGYVDAEYDSFVGGPCVLTPFGFSPDASDPGFSTVCDASGNVVPVTPELTWNGTVRVDRPLFNDVNGYGQLDFNWRDDTETGNDNDQNKVIESFALFNLRVGAALADGSVDVSLWGKNIFDEDYHGGAFNSVIREGSLTAYHTEPRTYGVTVRGRF